MTAEAPSRLDALSRAMPGLSIHDLMLLPIERVRTFFDRLSFTGIMDEATELLLATTNLDAKTVPLLRGAVVIATHDSDGDLDGLSWQQLDLLAARTRGPNVRT